MLVKNSTTAGPIWQQYPKNVEIPYLEDNGINILKMQRTSN